MQVTIYTINLYSYIQPPHSASYNIAATTTCASRVSAPVGLRKDHQCKLQWAQGTPPPFAPPHVPESNVAQWLKKKTGHQRKLQLIRTCTAAIGVRIAASKCNLPKGMPLNFCPYPQFNAMPLGKNEGLIKTSVSFKSLKISHTSKPHLAHVRESRQIPRTLFIYLIIYFRLVVYIVTCTAYFYLMMQKWLPLANWA